jgi:Zn-dependent M16 (insulinase) family peptidase
MAGFIKNRGISYPEIFESYKSFKEILQDFFSNSDQQATLERKILTITQKESALDYIAQL